jgi:hypothetical protein
MQLGIISSQEVLAEDLKENDGRKKGCSFNTDSAERGLSL